MKRTVNRLVASAVLVAASLSVVSAANAGTVLNPFTLTPTPVKTVVSVPVVKPAGGTTIPVVVVPTPVKAATATAPGASTPVSGGTFFGPVFLGGGAAPSAPPVGN